LSRTGFYLFYVGYAIAILYLATTLPIGPNEALVYYATEDRVLEALTHFAKGWFENGLDFRFPFVLFGLLNVPLFYLMSKEYFSEDSTRFLATMIFALLPGIITSAVLVNIAVLVITLVLLFLIFYKKKQVYAEVIVMILLLLIHDASIIFFISMAIFSAFKRDRLLFAFSIILMVISLFYFNKLDVGGLPSGKFMELFGLYMALFSPLVFIYFFYALYRIWLRERKDVLWYISFTAFALSILLSLRQQVIMTDFAPYVVVSVVLMILIYYRTVEVRLPQFQKIYKLGFYIVMFSLVITTFLIVFHKLFFSLIDDKSKHFTYPFYEPYWQIQELHEIGQNCYTVSNQKKQYQLKYYGIESCQE
jgi:hypothetical protein